MGDSKEMSFLPMTNLLQRKSKIFVVPGLEVTLGEAPDCRDVPKSGPKLGRPKKSEKEKFYLLPRLACERGPEGQALPLQHTREYLQKLLDGEIFTDQVDPRGIEETAEKKVISILDELIEDMLGNDKNNNDDEEEDMDNNNE